MNIKACGCVTLLLCLPAVVEAAEFQTLASTELGKADIKVGGSVHVASDKNGCVKYIKEGETVMRETCRTPKRVIIPYDDFLVMVSKVEHKDKLLNQCAAERGILIKLNDENGTIKKLNLQQIEALEGEAEARRKLGETQEQIVQAMEQQVSGITGELTHEKRLSRYKSEFVGIGAVILGILWVVN